MNSSSKNFTDLTAFLDYIGPALTRDAGLVDFTPKFPFLCSEHYADLIKNAEQPEALLREVLPLQEELKDAPGFVDDPVGDIPAGKSECVIQKYDGRALIMTTAACGVRCRFCFRRNYPFQSIPEIHNQVSRWLDVHSDIWEIILSGGDPLAISPNHFQKLVEAIASHDSVTTIRIHSRMPIMRPDIVKEHLDLLKELPARFDCVLVSHVDHYDELDENSAEVFAILKKAGWNLLNQSVLLKGVNDSAEVLIKLSRKLFEQGVLPYYLHQLDHAKGVAHFEVSDEQAKALIEKIRTKLPGYQVPKLVREVAGEKSKTPV